jgi:prepilin-type N-terminal cleavage/methylation domain-containing protein
MTLQRNNKGFTIVELLVVIIVIGILALITITAFNGVTQSARDSNREADIKAVHGQLEAFFATSGRYPTLAELNDSTFRSTNLRGLDDDALQDPRADNNTLAAAPAANVYSYEPTPAGCNDGTGGTPNPCTGYTLTGTLEGGGTTTKTALN